MIRCTAVYTIRDVSGDHYNYMSKARADVLRLGSLGGPRPDPLPFLPALAVVVLFLLTGPATT